jgi:hypothetical protein
VQTGNEEGACKGKAKPKGTQNVYNTTPYIKAEQYYNWARCNTKQKMQYSWEITEILKEAPHPDVF